MPGIYLTTYIFLTPSTGRVVIYSGFLNLATYRRSDSGYRLDSSDFADYKDEVRPRSKPEILLVHVIRNRAHGDLCYRFSQ